MESLALAAITHHVGIKSAVVCVTLLDRLTGDQVSSSVEFCLTPLDNYFTVFKKKNLPYICSTGKALIFPLRKFFSPYLPRILRKLAVGDLTPENRLSFGKYKSVPTFLIQINQSKKTLEEWQDRPMVIVGRYIKKYLKENGDIMNKIENKPKQRRSIACPDCVSLRKATKDNDESMKSTTSSAGSGSDSESSHSSTPSSSSSQTYGCLPGCSIIVSSEDYLQRVIDESNGVD